MLEIRSVCTLASLLGTTKEKLVRVAEHPERYYRELLLIDPTGARKDRTVCGCHRGALRILESKLYTGILLKKLQPSVHGKMAVSRGGRSGLMQPPIDNLSSYIERTSPTFFPASTIPGSTVSSPGNFGARRTSLTFARD